MAGQEPRPIQWVPNYTFKFTSAYQRKANLAFFFIQLPASLSVHNKDKERKVTCGLLCDLSCALCGIDVNVYVLDFNSHQYFILISDKYFQSFVIEGSIFPISYGNE